MAGIVPAIAKVVNETVHSLWGRVFIPQAIAKHPELVEGCDSHEPASFDKLRMLAALNIEMRRFDFFALDRI